MAPRIESAEVISFHLEVPLNALERLPDEVGALVLKVESRPENRICITSGKCQLSFLAVGSVGRLSEVTVLEDERGLFFQRVLGPLVVRHRGDLHVRLLWNVAERNSHGDFAEVRILQGITTYPGLSTLRNMLIGTKNLPMASADAALTPEEQEVDQLLEEARRHYEEYLRLKSARSQSQTT